MKNRKISTLLILCIALLAAGCNKDEGLKNYMVGKLSFSLPEYVEAGSEISLDPTEITLKDGSKAIGYTWEIPLFGIKDTTRVEKDPASVPAGTKITVKPVLKTITVNLTAWATGYYNSTATQKMIVVDPSYDGNGSLTGFVKYSGDGQFTDPRDNTVYPYTQIGTQTWMRRNLRYQGKGHPVMDSPVMAKTFCQFYTWEEAQSVCPEGWRLPTESDWATLAKHLGCSDAKEGSTFGAIAGKMMLDASFNGEKLWEYWPEVTMSDESHFSALPTGYGVNENGSYTYPTFSSYAFFWSAEDRGESGAARYFSEKNNNVYYGFFDKNTIIGAVRCIKE